ncbi:hypothetical protein NEOLEDRAFT_1138472 [Neolentinus lepideus HHB14362 ss-1]|uniref:SH3 domain-containing protein n=1 Tax=Neolentinus lepideus HHB14362 ss-1 TaxID=1314782 RepID=A0A165Q9Z5_9AGAM|nr:hypothetical protein NEOLEDRAFT_1138472 [Neolentinus lepideus HHB14362 ss-1]
MAPFAKPATRSPQASRSNSLDKYIVAETYVATSPSHISLNLNEEVFILDNSNPNLWKGQIDGREGWFPSSCVRKRG